MPKAAYAMAAYHAGTLRAEAKISLGAPSPFVAGGDVRSVSAGVIDVSDRLALLSVGARVEIETDFGPRLAEVLCVTEGAARCMSFSGLDGVRRGAPVRFLPGGASIAPSSAWRGRIIDALGRPIDGKGPLPQGRALRPLRASPPPAAMRARLGARVDFGVAALAAFSPARAGQRLGLFSGAGVGKSALLSMIARNTACDTAVVALIGERGREVREFVEDSLGADGLARAVVVVATSDEAAVMRREAAYLAMTIAEHFRDNGEHVLCLMDSLTRVAAAAREIGLVAGEPPTSKGYTPSVFSLLPKLLERAGPGREGRGGAVTGVFSVLVEGDDHDEPIADAARALLDGHIVLNRAIAERGRYPAVDILKSLSRTATQILSPEEQALVAEARALEAEFDDMREMIRIGAYQSGANSRIDRAILVHDRLEEMLTQDLQSRVSPAAAFASLAEILR